MEKTILINGKEYMIKQSFGVIMKFEQLRNKRISEMDESITDMIYLLYSMLVYNNKSFTFTMDEFIKILDDDNDIITQYTNYLVELQSNTVKEVKEENDKKKLKK